MNIDPSMKHRNATNEFIHNVDNVDRIRTDEFYVEDENLEIAFFFNQENDGNLSKIQWFKFNGTWIEIISLENFTVIDSSFTSPGELWYCTITSFDGEYIWRQRNSTQIKIESRPIILTTIEDIIQAYNDTEGHYSITVELFDQLNEVESSELRLNDSKNEVYYLRPTGIENIWSYDYQISPEDFNSFIGTKLVGELVLSSLVEYHNLIFRISNKIFLNFTIRDEAAPRVLESYFEKDKDQNPTNLTFYAEIQEYGSGIESVILFYYFSPVEENATGNGAKVYQELKWIQVPMWTSESNESLGYMIYKASVSFSPNKTDFDVIFRIYTLDNAGNIDPYAFDIRNYPQLIKDRRISYISPGISPLLIYIAFFAVLIIFVGSVVYIRFIRKPELIGFDKEVVLNKISEIEESNIMENVSLHTLGVVVSFFDQSHGPIPIIVIPEVLKDNYRKLVELSDRSFSNVGFSEGFKGQVISNYEFALTDELKTSIMTFSFALDRPDARGGKENITLNILIHQNIFPLLNQFQDVLQTKSKIVQELMDKSPKEKNTIKSAVFDVRKYASAITLAYESLYGTTDLLDEDDSKLEFLE